jgi:uncharacterized protein (TIGR02246 family)
MRAAKLGALLLLFAGAVQAQETQPAASADEQAVRDVANRYVEAWNKGDVKTVAALFAADADTVNAMGRMSKGQAEIEKNLGEEMAGMMKGSTLSVTTESVRSLTPDVALGNGTYEFAGVKGPDGKDMPLKGMYTTVLTKKDGQWQIAALRAMMPMPAGGAAGDAHAH